MSEILWEATLDRRYRLFVEQTGDWTGVLRITDNQSGRLLFQAATEISYGAVFGPDVFDIAGWQRIAEEFVDAFVAGKTDVQIAPISRSTCPTDKP